MERLPMTDIAKFWLHRIIGAFLQGAAHAGLAYAATAMAAPLAPTLGIVALNWKQLVCVMLGSGALKLLGVLERLGNVLQGKPDTGDTQIITK
jgi:hypothetical protein